MRTTGLVALVVAALSSPVTAAVAAPADGGRDLRATTRVIGVTGPEANRDVSRLGPWVVRPGGPATLAGARAAFGRPTRCRSLAEGYANASWAGAGLRASFYTLDIAPPGPACQAGSRLFVGSVTLTGPTWRTSTGLRVGDTLARVEELYPKADSTRKLYPGIGGPPGRWQLERRHVFGADSPLLSAVMRTGKVVAFEIDLGRGGE